MEMEQAMGQGQLGRKQAALLWLLHSEAGSDGWMPRKDIEATLGSWFEMSPPNVTKIIRDTASPPHEMIEIIESPGSGREKLLRLTPDGRAFVSTMIRSEEHTSELQSLIRISYAVFCLKKKNIKQQ